MQATETDKHIYFNTWKVEAHMCVVDMTLVYPTDVKLQKISKLWVKIPLLHLLLRKNYFL
jgi:hypothetical protein